MNGLGFAFVIIIIPFILVFLIFWGIQVKQKAELRRRGAKKSLSIISSRPIRIIDPKKKSHFFSRSVISVISFYAVVLTLKQPKNDDYSRTCVLLFHFVCGDNCARCFTQVEQQSTYYTRFNIQWVIFGTKLSIAD